VKYLAFVALCWKAYNGDYRAALEVLSILRDKTGVGVYEWGILPDQPVEPKRIES
jgi:hypothetical protein